MVHRNPILNQAFSSLLVYVLWPWRSVLWLCHIIVRELLYKTINVFVILETQWAPFSGSSVCVMWQECYIETFVTCWITWFLLLRLIRQTGLTQKSVEGLQFTQCSQEPVPSARTSRLLFRLCSCVFIFMSNFLFQGHIEFRLTAASWAILLGIRRALCTLRVRLVCNKAGMWHGHSCYLLITWRSLSAKTCPGYLPWGTFFRCSAHT